MNQIEKSIKMILESKTPASIKGTVIDTFTANIINTVGDRLTEENKEKFFAMPVNKMVAMSYKIMMESRFQNEDAAEDAKRQGLEYFGFGRWGKDGKVTHRSKNGKLVQVGMLGRAASHMSGFKNFVTGKIGNPDDYYSDRDVEDRKFASDLEKTTSDFTLSKIADKNRQKDTYKTYKDKLGRNRKKRVSGKRISTATLSVHAPNTLQAKKSIMGWTGIPLRKKYPLALKAMGTDLDNIRNWLRS